MRKYFKCPCCGSIGHRLWIDGACPACVSLGELLMIVDPVPFSRKGNEIGRTGPTESMNREQIEDKLAISFARLTERYGAETIRVRIASRGLNDWAKWHYENWLARHEGRDPPAEPGLFQAMREAWLAKKWHGTDGPTAA